MPKYSHKIVSTIAAIVGLLITPTASHAQTTVRVDPGATWVGYMNVFELNDTTFAFGQPWTATADLNASFSGPTLTLTPNTSISRDVALSDTFWWTGGGQGNKSMHANFYVQNDALAGQTVTFTGSVTANTLVSPYTSSVFIRDFAPDFSSFNTITAPVVNGTFTIALATINDPARHVQYGFETVGPNARLDQVSTLGSVTVQAVPEPSAMALIGLGVVGVLAAARSRKAQSKP